MLLTLASWTFTIACLVVAVICIVHNIILVIGELTGRPMPSMVPVIVTVALLIAFYVTPLKFPEICDWAVLLPDTIPFCLFTILSWSRWAGILPTAGDAAPGKGTSPDE